MSHEDYWAGVNRGRMGLPPISGAGSSFDAGFHAGGGWDPPAKKSESTLWPSAPPSWGSEPSRGGAGCFPGTAMILTPDGETPIGQLQAGDTVLSVADDRAGNKYAYRRIMKVRRYEAAALARVSFTSDHVPLRATPRHTVLTAKGWRRVDQLRHGDRLISTPHDRMVVGPEVAAVIQEAERIPVFNLVTEGEHNFVADGIVVHNFTVLRRTRVFLYRLAAQWRLTTTRAGQPRRHEPAGKSVAV